MFAHTTRPCKEMGEMRCMAVCASLFKAVCVAMLMVVYWKGNIFCGMEIWGYGGEVVKDMIEYGDVGLRGLWG